MSSPLVGFRPFVRADYLVGASQPHACRVAAGITKRRVSTCTWQCCGTAYVLAWARAPGAVVLPRGVRRMGTQAMQCPELRACVIVWPGCGGPAAPGSGPIFDSGGVSLARRRPGVKTSHFRVSPLPWFPRWPETGAIRPWRPPPGSPSRQPHTARCRQWQKGMHAASGRRLDRAQTAVATTR